MNISADRLQVRLAESEADVRASQHLRYRVFCEEMSVTATREMIEEQRDFDSYDDFCDHLLVIDQGQRGGHGMVVGTYRLTRREAAEKLGRFYTASEYDIEPLLAYPGEILELGRTCVHRDYRTRSMMELLWRGIAEYMFYYNIDLMFGCASLPDVEPARLALPLSYLYNQHLAPPALRPHALPELFVDMDMLRPDSIDTRQALKSLPPLVRGYLRLGAFVGDGAVVDLEFGTTDICIVVRTDLFTGLYGRRDNQEEVTDNNAGSARPLPTEMDHHRTTNPKKDRNRASEPITTGRLDLEAEHLTNVPPQRPGTIEVEYRDDGKLHRRPSQPPKVRDSAQEERLRAAWSAQSGQLSRLEDLSPGQNLPSLDRAIVDYRAALGSTFEQMNVIAVGVHGTVLVEYAQRSDVLLLEDAASELRGLVAAHGLFIRQFNSWRDYISDATGNPPDEAVAAAIDIARSLRDAPEIIADDLAVPINQLADATLPLLDADTSQPPRLIKVELLRSVGNLLSGLFSSLVAYARDAGLSLRKGSLEGIKDYSKQVTLALAIGGSAYVAALAAGLPSEFGWIIPILAYLKMKLSK